jgi:hypothetical protein
MGTKDLEGMLELFDYDVVVYEPFSKEEGLYGISAIEPFLKVALMANSDLRRTVKIKNLRIQVIIIIVSSHWYHLKRGRSLTEDLHLNLQTVITIIIIISTKGKRSNLYISNSFKPI